MIISPSEKVKLSRQFTTLAELDVHISSSVPSRVSGSTEELTGSLSVSSPSWAAKCLAAVSGSSPIKSLS